jgi:Holliday junction resolvase RusA-like endonuclease
MKTVNTVIFVEPTAKARARVAVFNGHVHGYTPRKTANAESLIIASIRQEMGANIVHFEAGTPLRLEATFYRVKPKSTPKRVTMPVTKPDCDNYGKLLMDALNHFVFVDDSQVTTLILKKRFARPEDHPRIELTIQEDIS